MILVTTPSVDGKRTTQVLGLVQGNTVRARHVGRDIIAVIRSIIGGEIGQYSALLNESRDQAIERMVQQAESLGANAIVNLRLATSMIMSSTAEILVYGTAIVVED